MKSKILKFFVNQKIFYSLIGKIYFKKYNFKIIKQYKIDALWGEFVCSNSMEVPIGNLFPILNSVSGYEKIQIENSPHFKLIKSYEQKQKLDISDYIDYYTMYFPNENIEEKIQKFIDLFNNISEDNSKLFVCVKKEASSFKDSNFKILDGLHRISIAKALNIKIIKIYIVDSIKNY